MPPPSPYQPTLETFQNQSQSPLETCDNESQSLLQTPNNVHLPVFSQFANPSMNNAAKPVAKKKTSKTVPASQARPTANLKDTSKSKRATTPPPHTLSSSDSILAASSESQAKNQKSQRTQEDYTALTDSKANDINSVHINTF